MIKFQMSSFLADENLCFKDLCTSISKDGVVPLDAVGGGVVGGKKDGKQTGSCDRSKGKFTS